MCRTPDRPGVRGGVLVQMRKWQLCSANLEENTIEMSNSAVVGYGGVKCSRHFRIYGDNQELRLVVKGHMLSFNLHSFIAFARFVVHASLESDRFCQEHSTHMHAHNPIQDPD